MKQSNANVMSVCGSTYCLSERRSMELCFVEIELDLTACLDFSCFSYMFHSIFDAFFMRQLLAQHFGYQIALKIASRSRVSMGNRVYSSLVGLDPYSNSMT